MLEIYSQPDVRAYAIASALGAAIETVLTCDDISKEVGERLTGLLSLARAEALRLSDDLDPMAVDIAPRGSSSAAPGVRS
ncbi:hypothetical protein ACLBWX_08410 [Methylobacterium sp. M6A4_1b]